MKIKIDIECTPQEARTFFGLPDMEPIQKAMMDRLQERMEGALSGLDAEALLKTWLPSGLQGGLQGLEQMQKAFWTQMAGASPARNEKKGED